MTPELDPLSLEEIFETALLRADRNRVIDFVVVPAEFSISKYAESMEKRREARLDGLLPGHGAISLSRARAHVDASLARYDAPGVPPNFRLPAGRPTPRIMR